MFRWSLLGLLALSAACTSAETRPASASRKPAGDRSELVGRELPEWTFSDWVNGSEPRSRSELRGSVVVVRFWTVGCPFCKRSMPALQTLADELEGKPVVFIGAFHDKPVGSVADMTEPLKVARSWGIRFPLAFDRDWKTLRRWWLDAAPRDATSATFVFGKDGRVAHVHPGPEYYPSDDPDDAGQNRDFFELRRAIADALAK